MITVNTALAGVTAQSDVDSLNRAALLSDGQKIIVPVKSEYSSVEVEIDDERINLNQADLGHTARQFVFIIHIHPHIIKLYHFFKNAYNTTWRSCDSSSLFILSPDGDGN